MAGESHPGPVGIVLVSHSAPLAAALAEMLLSLAARPLPVVAAGGTGNDGGDGDGHGGGAGFGTSEARIRAAIGRADRGAGVLILTDLGSAVLTAKTVLADEPREDVVLVDAPFVEGAVAAAVIAAAGADLAEVATAARQAREFRKL